MAARCLITTLELPDCEMKGQDVEKLAGVLAQCPALAHLDISGNSDFRAGGAERLAGVLGQCRELVHLNLGGRSVLDVSCNFLSLSLSPNIFALFYPASACTRSNPHLKAQR
jgi:hypothetical protein